MLQRIRRHYKQAHQAQQLTYQALAAPEMKEKVKLLGQVKKIGETHDPEALPKWVCRSIEWYVGNLAPLLFPYGNPYSNFMFKWRCRLSRFLRSLYR